MGLFSHPMAPPLSQFTVGDTLVQFDCGADRGPVQLSLRPKGLPAAKHREFLPEEGVEIRGLPQKWRPIRAWSLDSLVQLKCLEDTQAPGFGQGRTMRANPSTATLRFMRQKVVEKAGATTVTTTLKHPSGLIAEHQLSWQGKTPLFTSRVRVRNGGKKPVTLEMLSSFSLGGLTPYAPDDAPERLTVHRFRSTWSAEGRLESRSIEELQLERSWIGHGIACERFGQVGSMPVRGFFPFVALEDREAGVIWGAQLAWPGSWQMEVYRRDDFVSLSGGLADRELGHWMKTLAPGESLETPAATLACLRGDLDQFCQRLTSAQLPALLEKMPAVERDLPIVVNEWCTSWGSPTQSNLLALAQRLHGTPAKYLVIDDGWSEKPGDGIQQNGDWIINRAAFPDGLDQTCQAIRELGFIPGIWFEFEVCNEGSKAFALSDHQLHRDGRVIQVGNRRFWDFRDPFTADYLTKKVIHLLRDNGLGYLKVDYNDTIGIGCDGAQSLGEGLRQHLEGMQNFFRKLRRELPELVIENCSSGGHRLEPSMMALTSMGSFSDAHETWEIPIIAANLQRLILPRQSQIWAVLRKIDTPQRLGYSLAATFLGRMCLSGDVHDLSPSQWKLTVSAMELYRRVVPLIRDGVSIFHGDKGPSWRHPRGWQAVVRFSQRQDRALVVAHSFARPFSKQVEIALPGPGWQLEEAWPAKGGLGASVSGSRLKLALNGEFRAVVAVLRRPGPLRPTAQNPIQQTPDTYPLIP